VFALFQACLVPEVDIPAAKTGGDPAPKGRETFFALASEREATPATMWPIVTAIISARAARPTPPPSVSSDGRRRIGVSSSPASPRRKRLTPREKQKLEEAKDMIEVDALLDSYAASHPG
jgi:hypothetical protein